MEAGMKVEVEEAMELEDQLHKRFKHDPSLLAAMESGTEPVTESAMESVTKPPETIWKSIRDRVLRSSDLPLTSEKGYGMEYIFYPYWTNSDRLLIKIAQTGLDLNEVDREFAKLVPPPPPEVKTNLVLMICFFDKHPEKGYTFAWVRDFSSLYNAGKSYACDDDDDLIDDEADDPDEAEVDDPDKAEVDKAEVDEDEDEDEDEDDDDDDDDDGDGDGDEHEDDGNDFLYVVKSNKDPFDREDNSGDRFGFRRNYERTLAARIRRVMSKRTECRYVFGFN